jgi:hypothetical protein
MIIEELFQGNSGSGLENRKLTNPPPEIFTNFSSQQNSRTQEEIASTKGRDSPAIPVDSPGAPQLPPLITARPITKPS